MLSQAAFFKELIPLKKKKEMLEAMCLDIFITWMKEKPASPLHKPWDIIVTSICSVRAANSWILAAMALAFPAWVMNRRWEFETRTLIQTSHERG